MARKRRYAAAKAVARHADQLSATPVSIENSQGSAASPRKRRGLRGPTLPKPEDQSEMDPDSFRERKRPPSVEGFWDDRGIQTQVPDNDEAHDAKLSSDFAPVTTDQGWDVASLVDYRSHTDRQVGEVPGVTASFPDKADAASGDHARPTVRQILSHQAVLQARIQRSSAQKRPCSRQLRSPISISFAPDTKTHRISGRRRRRRSGKGKPECNRRYKAAVAHVGYPPPSGLDWFTDGKQAARTERPPERQGIVPSGVHDSLIPCYAGQTDHYAARVGDQTSHGPNRELPPSQPPPPGTEQPRANHWYGSSVTSAPRAMEENSRRLPPIRNLGHAFSTPVLANVQPQPPEGGPPPGYQNVMHHGRHHAELLNSRAPPGSLGPRSQAHLQHMRPHQICTPYHWQGLCR